MRLRDYLGSQWLIDSYMFGVVLTDDNNTPYPDSLYTHAIASAIETVEHELDILIDGYKPIRDERHDVLNWHQATQVPINLLKRPVKAVTGFRLGIGNNPEVNAPLSTVNLCSSITGQVQLIPTADGVSSSVGGLPWSYFFGYGREYTPAWYRFDYTAGMFGGHWSGAMATTSATYTPWEAIEGRVAVELDVAPTGTPGAFTVTGIRRDTGLAGTETVAIPVGSLKATGRVEFDSVSSVELDAYGTATTWGVDVEPAVPSAILDAIGRVASMLPLDTAGDLIAGAGIASFSTSMDGLSSSVSTTSSATNAGYGARILSYQKQLEKQLDSLKRKYRVRSVFAL